MYYFCKLTGYILKWSNIHFSFLLLRVWNRTSYTASSADETIIYIQNNRISRQTVRIRVQQNCWKQDELKMWKQVSIPAI